MIGGHVSWIPTAVEATTDDQTDLLAARKHLAGLLDCAGDWKAVKDVSTACSMSQHANPAKEKNVEMSGLLF